MVRAFVVDVVFGRHPEWTQACAAPTTANIASWQRAGEGRLPVRRDRRGRRRAVPPDGDRPEGCDLRQNQAVANAARAERRRATATNATTGTTMAMAVHPMRPIVSASAVAEDPAAAPRPTSRPAHAADPRTLPTTNCRRSRPSAPASGRHQRADDADELAREDASPTRSRQRGFGRRPTAFADPAAQPAGTQASAGAAPDGIADEVAAHGARRGDEPHQHHGRVPARRQRAAEQEHQLTGKDEAGQHRAFEEGGCPDHQQDQRGG